ncbi:hypothetical protein HUJ05_000725 [Dendroctonus ponderosae]|nr:hypothetical protein HUJ05_000725 [Dendroctonus ponderosae]
MTQTRLDVDGIIKKLTAPEDPKNSAVSSDEPVLSFCIYYVTLYITIRSGDKNIKENQPSFDYSISVKKLDLLLYRAATYQMHTMAEKHFLSPYIILHKSSGGQRPYPIDGRKE